MKLALASILIIVWASGSVRALLPRNNKPVVAAVAGPPYSLAQDLNEIVRLIPSKQIQRLLLRYLINDAQFQTFVRTINSHDGYLTQMRFRAQPEVTSLRAWLRSQIMLSEVELQSEESNESLRIINRTPFWSQNVFGWQGFVREFLLYYPEEAIRNQMQTKAAQSAVFAEFVERLRTLGAAYERVIVMPEGQRIRNALESAGIDAAAIDHFIRNQFGWQRAVNRSIVAAGAP